MNLFNTHTETYEIRSPSPYHECITHNNTKLLHAHLSGHEGEDDGGCDVHPRHEARAWAADSNDGVRLRSGYGRDERVKGRVERE